GLHAAQSAEEHRRGDRIPSARDAGTDSRTVERLVPEIRHCEECEAQRSSPRKQLDVALDCFAFARNDDDAKLRAAMIPSFLFFHVLSAVVWVGGMFFAHQMVRPSVAPLDAPVRLALWRRIFERFFAW